MNNFMEMLLSYSNSAFAAAVYILIIIILNVIFRNIKYFRNITEISRKLIIYLIVLAGIITFLVHLPIDKQVKSQIISLMGILISAAIALSSTTILGNLLAGLMNNTMNRFRNGDLIRVADIQGRVTRKSIFHVEIQLEDSNFLTIPNIYIASNPVKLIRKSDTVISASVSLGYDVSRHIIEKCLIEAAMEAGLTDPFVYIQSLGDFSVSYIVHGFLENSDKYFSSISELKGKVIDHLHEQGIEIVSPSFMNQRRVDDAVFIPKEKPVSEKIQEKSPENLVFDKAIESEKIEEKKIEIEELIKKKEELRQKLKEVKDKKEAEKIKDQMKAIEIAREHIMKKVEDREKDLSK